MEIIKFEPKEGLNLKHRKVDNFVEEYAVLNLDGNVRIETLIVRFYHSKSTHYCCVWSNGKPYFTGSAQSDSQRYALISALKSAGIEFDKNTTDVAYEEIFIKVANQLGFNNLYIHHSNP